MHVLDLHFDRQKRELTMVNPQKSICNKENSVSKEKPQNNNGAARDEYNEQEEEEDYYEILIKTKRLTKDNKKRSGVAGQNCETQKLKYSGDNAGLKANENGAKHKKGKKLLAYDDDLVNSDEDNKFKKK